MQSTTHFVLKFSFTVLTFVVISGQSVCQEEKKIDVFSSEFQSRYQTPSGTLVLEPAVQRDLELTAAQTQAVVNHVSTYRQKSRDLVNLGLQELIKTYSIENGDKVHDVRMSLLDKARKEMVACVRSELSDKQNARLRQIIFQVTLQTEKPLGTYTNSLLNHFIDLTWEERNEIHEKVVELRGKYYQELVDLRSKYFQRIRESITMQRAELLKEIIGEPIISPSSSECDDRSEFDDVFSPEFSMATHVQVSKTVTHPWFRRDLDITREQQEQLNELNKETRSNLHPEKYNEILDNLYQEKTEDTTHEELDLESERRYTAHIKNTYVNYYKRVDEILRPEQVQRIRQIMIQKGLNNPAPFGIFVNKHFIKLAKITPHEKQLLSKAIADALPQYSEKEKEIHSKYHTEIRSAFSLENQKKLEELLGEPFEYLGKAIYNPEP